MTSAVERMLCGVAVPFGQWGRNMEAPEFRGDYEELVRTQPGARVWIDHAPPILTTGVLDGYGVVRRWTLTGSCGAVPAGLLVLAELADDPHGAAALEAVRRGALWGLSRGGAKGTLEVSLTGRPAYPDARVIGTGERALATWELLTGEQVGVPA